MDAGYLSIRTALLLAVWLCTIYAWMSVAAKVAHCGLGTGLHVSLYNPTTFFVLSEKRKSKRDEEIE